MHYVFLCLTLTTLETRCMDFAQSAFGSLSHMWTDHRLSRATKLKLYRLSVCSSLTHCCTAWTLTSTVVRRSNGFNSRCLHVITGENYRTTATKIRSGAGCAQTTPALPWTLPRGQSVQRLWRRRTRRRTSKSGSDGVERSVLFGAPKWRHLCRLCASTSTYCIIGPSGFIMNKCNDSAQNQHAQVIVIGLFVTAYEMRFDRRVS